MRINNTRRLIPPGIFVKTLAYSIIAASLSLFSLDACAFKALPADLLSQAISSSVSYDEEFDYVKLKRIDNLPLYADGISATQKKGLIDHVVVHKLRHEMMLMRKDQIIKKFWIALSDRPSGAKKYEGDRRTPEGTYTLDYIKNNSRYYKAFHISYPNAHDIAEARSMGRRPGGMIMVHGQPASKGNYEESVQRTDWTNGCIALLNPDLDVFLSMVDVGTPITINP